ncbi:MAG: glycosyltransferase family 2 protein [Prochlorococcaceae cyanobacterium]
MAAGGTGSDRRRLKAGLFLVVCMAAGLAPHGLPAGQALLPALLLTAGLGGYSLRTVLPQLRRKAAIVAPAAAPAAEAPAAAPAAAPGVDLVVAARDEEAVIVRLVERLSRLRYPAGALKLWVVDDGSEDRTPELLADQARRHPFLKVLSRSRDAGGGKSGALNTVRAQLQGRWMLVLDADAQLQDDLLERLIPYAEAGGWSAVQLRKAVVNGEENLLSRAQAMEMVLDTVVQCGRLAAGGVAELRGNGQLLLREAVQACGGFNEDTVTDDLDLSFRLLLAGQPVGVLWDPPVQEEAVLTLAALWRQRQRWAEGGLQRFLDYWPGLIAPPLTISQRIDLACFFLLQYALPVVSIADLLGALLSHTQPTIWPLSLVVFSLSGLAIVAGCRRTSEGPPLPAITPLGLALGMVYMAHWFVVIPWTTLRMALLPKRLVWAKTLHLGSGEAAEACDLDLDVDEADLSTQIS